MSLDLPRTPPALPELAEVSIVCTSGEAATLHVALSYLATFLLDGPYPLGDDDHGRAMTAAHTANAVTLFKKLQEKI
jgi:hypothetical protein